jgi:hypothetical protein
MEIPALLRVLGLERAKGIKPSYAISHQAIKIPDGINVVIIATYRFSHTAMVADACIRS